MATKNRLIRKTSDMMIRAAASPDAGKPVSMVASFQIEAEAAPAQGQKAKPRQFTMTAYNGGVISVGAFYYPVVVDLTGLQGTDKTRPIFRNHDPEQLVGHATKISVKGNSLSAEGVISGAGSAATEVLAAHDNGFPWQASIGARVLNLEFVREGSKATANGQEFTGPINIARKSVLGEISFVPLGADDTTSARIAATAAESANMDFAKWVAALGFSVDALTEDQKKSLQAKFDAEQAAVKAAAQAASAGGASNGGGKPAGNKRGKKAVLAAAGAAVTASAEDDDSEGDGETDPAVDMRASAAAERKRQIAISKVCAGYKSELAVEKLGEIEAEAIEKDWDADKTELALIRAARPTAPAAHIRDNALTGSVIEAAICIGGGLDIAFSFEGRKPVKSTLDKVFGEKTIEAAHKRFRRGIGLQELLVEAATMNGYSGGAFSVKSDLQGVLRAAFGNVQAAGFSTISLPGIMSNVANKFLLAGFMNVESIWRAITAVRPVNDFKTVTSYRLTGDMQFEKVGADGELKHGKLGEESFTNKADTYGKMFSITRQDIINDDLGALTAVPKKIGRGSALKLNDVFWSTFLNNSTFFTAGNNNVSTGAGSALGIDGLTTAEQKFFDQVDADGKPLGATPAILLVPTALNARGASLMNSTEIRDTTASTKYPTNNPHAGKWKPYTSAYMANSSYTGSSAAAWYLLADPNDIAVIEVAFLNGVEQPTVESADADFNVLGVQMRGYFDFGVSLQDSRGGVRSAGS